VFIDFLVERFGKAAWGQSREDALESAGATVET
jgi:hypothetical protein